MKLGDYLGKARRVADNPLSTKEFEEEMEIARSKFCKELRKGRKGMLE